MQDDLLRSVDRKKCVLVMLPDMNAARDTANGLFTSLFYPLSGWQVFYYLLNCSFVLVTSLNVMYSTDFL